MYKREELIECIKKIKKHCENSKCSECNISYECASFSDDGMLVNPEMWEIREDE